ncbi:hypothetical protein AAVH_27410 [Aphelenchoides avenae]|nr:hypothetical protein AAVH_27410 [Aphelenchus avenae]
MEELPAGTTDEGLLEQLFGESAPRTACKRIIGVKQSRLQGRLGLLASQTTIPKNDVEIDIELSSLVRQSFPPDLQIQPTYNCFKNANAYHVKTTYSCSFADVRPRTLVVLLSYFDENGTPPQSLLEDPLIEWRGPPPGIKYKMRAGTLYTDKLIVTFT